MTRRRTPRRPEGDGSELNPSTAPQGDAVVGIHLAPEDTDREELRGWRRALDALTPERRAMVLRMVKVLSLAAELPAQGPRRSRLAPIAANDGPEGDPGDVEGDAADELSRAHARRILAKHGRRDGAA